MVNSNDSTNNEATIIAYENLIFWHSISIYLGSIGTIINIILLTILLTYKKFRRKYKLLICLALGDLCNCLGVALMGARRVELYSIILQTWIIKHQILQTSLTCATEVYVWLRTIGALWPPIVQVITGFDKAVSVLTPIWYRRHLEARNGHLCLFTIIFVLFALFIALMLAFLHADETASYYCGRKAAFTAGYGMFLYANEIFGYFCGLLLNVIAYLCSGRILKTSAMRIYLTKSRYTLVISLLSSILVSCPNALSVVMAQMHRKLPIAIIQSVQWLSLANSSKNLFVYIAMSKEFRQRIYLAFNACQYFFPFNSENIIMPTVNQYVNHIFVSCKLPSTIKNP